MLLIPPEYGAGFGLGGLRGFELAARVVDGGSDVLWILRRAPPRGSADAPEAPEVVPLSFANARFDRDHTTLPELWPLVDYRVCRP